VGPQLWVEAEVEVVGCRQQHRLLLALERKPWRWLLDREAHRRLLHLVDETDDAIHVHFQPVKSFFYIRHTLCFIVVCPVIHCVIMECGVR